MSLPFLRAPHISCAVVSQTVPRSRRASESPSEGALGGAGSRATASTGGSDAVRGRFPWGIFVVNISGAFLIGLLVELMEPRFEDAAWFRTAVLTGFLGAYTTFSTLSLDTYRLLDEGHIASALMNSLGSLALGLVAVWLGLKTGRALAVAPALERASARR